MDAKKYIKRAAWIVIPLTLVIIAVLLLNFSSGPAIRGFSATKLADATVGDLIWVLLIFSALWSSLRASK